MNREIFIALRGRLDPEETALLLEVIAGEIRNGRRSGDDPHYSWYFSSSENGDRILPPSPVTIFCKRDLP